MTLRPIALSCCALAVTGTLALAQPPAARPRARTPSPEAPGEQAPQPRTPAARPAPEAAEAPRRPRPEPQAINIKVEVSIADQRSGTATPLKKTVTVVTGDGLTGFIRSSARYVNLGNVPLNVDVAPQLLPDGKIRMGLNLQYSLPGSAGQTPPAEPRPADAATSGALALTEIHESLSLILESGKAIAVAQSADPVGDRQVTIEVKATVLK